jgi:hypothetical protein
MVNTGFVVTEEPPMNNEQYMQLFEAFHAVGDIRKHQLKADNARRIELAYNRLKEVLRDGHPTMGHAMVARGIKKPEDFYL